MKRIVWIFLGCIPLLPSVSHADYLVQGIRTICTKGGFEIEAVNLLNEDPNSDVVQEGHGKVSYYGTKTYSVSCQVGAHRVKAAIYNEEPSERGACGGEPGSTVNLWVDNVQINGNQPFNVQCYESLNKMSYIKNKKSKYFIKICGHNSSDSGCFVVEENVYRSLIDWTEPFPFSKLLENKTLKLIPNE